MIFSKLFSSSSYTITSDIQFQNFDSTNVVVIGTANEAKLLLNNHFEKIVSTSFPSKRHSYAADYSSTTQKTFLFGGIDQPQQGLPTYFNDCWIFDETKNQWEYVFISSINLPPRRYGHSIVNIGGSKFLIFGGLGENSVYYNDTYIFDLQTSSFQLVITSSYPSARYYHSMCFVSDEDKVYLFGGYSQYGTLNDMWYFDIKNLTWNFVEVSGIKPQPRLGHKMVYVQQQKKIYIFGGETSLLSNQLNDLWYFDLQTKTFTQIIKSGNWPDPISHFGMTNFPELNQILIFGGYKGSGSYSDELWFLNYVSTTFAKSNYDYTTEKPCGRNFFSFIKLKDKFFIFGGTSGYAALSDTFIYHYSTYGVITGDLFIQYNPTNLIYKKFIFSPSPDTGSDVKFQIAYSTDGKTYSQFLGYDGTPNTYFSSTQQNFLTTTFNNKQYLKLRGYFYSYNPPKNPYVDEIVINYNLTPYPPQLVLIGNKISNIQSSINTTQPEFRWEQPADPDGDNITSYRLQISKFSDFSSPVLDQSGITTTYFKPSTEIQTETYFWRVCAKDTDESSFSSIYIIEIDTTAPYAPYYILATPHPTLDKSIRIETVITGDDLSTGTFRGAIIVAYSSYTFINETNFNTVENKIFDLRDTQGNYISYPPQYKIQFDLTNLQNDTTYFLAIKLQDEALNLSTMSVCISTITNFIPWLNIITPTTDSELKGDKVNISWQYGDFNTDDTTHTFIISLIDENTDSTTTIKNLTNTTYYIFNSLEVKNSTYTLKIEIIDTRGAKSYDTVSNIKIVNTNFEPQITGWVLPQKNQILTGTVKISWQLYDPNLADEHFYELYITTDLSRLNLKIAEFKNTTEYLLDTTLFLNDTNYYLILKVEDSGSPPLITVSTSPVFAIKNQNLPPKKPGLVSPKHLSYTSPYKVKFLWEESTDPNLNDKVFYDFYLSTDSNFNFNLVFQTNLTTTYFEVLYPIIDEEKRYFWKVIAKDMFDTETPSDTFMFMTYPKYKTISDDNLVYAELIEIPQEKIFVYITKLCDFEERITHPIVSLADKKDKTDRLIKIIPYNVYDINLYDENFNLITREIKYKLIFSFDETQYYLPLETFKISYLNQKDYVWEFPKYRQEFVPSKDYALTKKNAISTYTTKFGIYTLLARNIIDNPVSNIVIYPNPFNPQKNEVVTIEYVLTEDVDVEVYILTPSGGLVKKFFFQKGIPGKSDGSPEGERNSFIWDGKNDKGEYVSSGMYICKLILKDKIEYRYIGVVKK
ncbi:MAG: kelch repeat-containing protein [Endomicrobiia bacterium]